MVRRHQTPVFESLVDELLAGSTANDELERGRPAAGREALWSINAVEGAASDKQLADRYQTDIDEAERFEPSALPTDRESILSELGLRPGVTAEQVASVRRQFALQNHPDRFTAELQPSATERMKIANAICDGYILMNR